MVTEASEVLNIERGRDILVSAKLKHICERF
jgi:hypothetical protein